MKAIALWGALTSMAVVGTLPWLRFMDAPSTQQPMPAEKIPHVEVAHPKKKTIYRKLRLPGEVRPNQEAAIYARVQGYIDEVCVDRGDWVKVGQDLAKIGVPELQKQLLKEIAERDYREKVWTRLEGIAAKSRDLVNATELDDAKGRYEVAKREVERIEALIAFATVQVPFDAVVSERWVDRGVLVQPGVTKMFHLQEVGTVRIRIHVPQSDVPSVRRDSVAEITVDELPDVKVTLPASRLFWTLSRETKTMAVEIDVQNENTNRTKWIRPGMFARVTLELEPRPDVLVLPASALIVEKKKTSVFVVEEDVAKKQEIHIGLDNGVEFEVKSGVTEADDVVVTGKNLVSDGDKVRVTRR